MIRQGAVTPDGRGEAVVGIVMMLIGAKSRVVVNDVKAKVEPIKKSLPGGVTIDTSWDRTDLTTSTIKTVARNLSEGGLLVVVVLLVLLGDLRGGPTVASAIPLSMSMALTAMRFAGLSGNLMRPGVIDSLILGVRSEVAIKIYGDNLELMKKTAGDVPGLLNHVPGVADVKAEQVIGPPTLRVRINRDAMTRQGINAADILDVIEAIGGKQ